MQYLCISIRPLFPMWHGYGRVAGHATFTGEANRMYEYPPAPLRLYKSLVAWAHTGAYALDSPALKRAALEWLESLPPPIILAPPHRPTQGRVQYGYANNTDQKPVDELRRPKRYRGLWWGEGVTLYYFWPIAEMPDSAILTALKREVRRITVFGRSIDIVTADLEVINDTNLKQLQDKTARWYIPVPAEQARFAKIILPVPRSGTLRKLDEVHHRKLDFPSKRIPPHYDTIPKRDVPYVMRHQPAFHSPRWTPRHFAAFQLVAPDNPEMPVGCIHTHFAQVAAMLRHAAIVAAEAHPQDFPGGIRRFIAGHMNDQEATDEKKPVFDFTRLAYIPIPSIGNPNADGHIRRVLVVEPPGHDGQWARWAAESLHMEPLISSVSRKPIARLSLILKPEQDPVIRQFLGLNGATEWVSVTPVILPGRSDAEWRVRMLAMIALQNIGIYEDILDELQLQDTPFVFKSYTSRMLPRYFIPRHLAEYTRRYMRIRLKQPITGPLAVGAGQFMGFGLMLPVASA